MVLTGFGIIDNFVSYGRYLGNCECYGGYLGNSNFLGQHRASISIGLSWLRRWLMLCFRNNLAIRTGHLLEQRPIAPTANNNALDWF